MPDGVLQPTETTAPEQAAEADRRRDSSGASAATWSCSAAATTLVVLLSLGVALYLAVAGSLANSGVGPAPGQRMARSPRSPDRPATRTRATNRPYGFQFGSPTFALRRSTRTTVSSAGRATCHLPPGLPNDDAVAASRRPAGQDLRTATVNKTPVRILTETSPASEASTFTVQVVQDRTAEQQTLDAMLIVLIVGGDGRRRWWRSGSGRSMRGGRSCRSANRWRTSGRPSAASASSPPTRATSCARR